jgi:drug/metabolite transporter (DMT)-like permease
MIGEIASLGAALTFGLSTILARRFMSVLSPEAGVLVSIAVNVVVFVTLACLAAVRGLLPPILPWSIVLFVAGGLAGTLVGRNMAYQSLIRLGAALTTTIRLSNSIFSLVIAYALLHELPRAMQVVGLVTVTAGLWISLGPKAAVPTRSPRAIDLAGVFLALGSAAAFALGDTARRAGLHLTPAPVLGAAIGATAALAAHLTWSIFNRSARWPAPSALWRFDVIGSAVLNTVAILLLYTGLRHSPVAIVSVLYNLQVMVVLAAGPLILRGQELVTPWLLAGALLALVGTGLILLG